MRPLNRVTKYNGSSDAAIGFGAVLPRNVSGGEQSIISSNLVDA